MRTLVTYYSYSGNTEKVVNIFKEVLEKRGELEIQRIRPKKEITSFLGQCVAARSGKRCEIEDLPLDVSGYDTVIIGSPVWAFAPAPAVSAYLDKVTGLSNKKTVILLTSGSGAGVKACFKRIHDLLSSKGASGVSEVNIPNARMKEQGFIVASLEKALL
ncbi:MAG: NAD(P)H-dependent oxidoreductase [Candidatus Omnitrophota bacterium]